MLVPMLLAGLVIIVILRVIYTGDSRQSPSGISGDIIVRSPEETKGIEESRDKQAKKFIIDLQAAGWREVNKFVRTPTHGRVVWVCYVRPTWIRDERGGFWYHSDAQKSPPVPPMYWKEAEEPVSYE